MMVEAIAAWICLLIALFGGDPLWAIASGVFAVATQIESLRKKGSADVGDLL